MKNKNKSSYFRKLKCEKICFSVQQKNLQGSFLKLIAPIMNLFHVFKLPSLRTHVQQAGVDL